MFKYVGNVLEFRLEPGGGTSARITCPEKAFPNPGQYVMAYSPDDVDAVVADTLFPGEILTDGFVVAPPVPHRWGLGTSLRIRGPLGRGFKIPKSARNLGFIALGETLARIIPLVKLTVRANGTAVLFVDSPLASSLPPEVEVHPLSALADMQILNLAGGVSWADLLVIDLPNERLSVLRNDLGLGPSDRIPIPIQVLITIPMPCGGLADCGVCAVPGVKGYKLACKDGPVFDLHEIAW